MVRKKFLCGFFTLAFVVGLCGCASLGKGPSDEELIQQTLAQWKAGIESHDVDMMMATISEEFVSEEGSGKADFREFLTDLIDDGTLAGAQMDLESAMTTIEGDMATVENATLSGDRGSIVLHMDLKKEADGIWRIVGIQAY
jgi:ketosteroid isomerase-like protein